VKVTLLVTKWKEEEIPFESNMSSQNQINYVWEPLKVLMTQIIHAIIKSFYYKTIETEYQMTEMKLKLF